MARNFLVVQDDARSFTSQNHPRLSQIVHRTLRGPGDNRQNRRLRLAAASAHPLRVRDSGWIGWHYCAQKKAAAKSPWSGLAAARFPLPCSAGISSNEIAPWHARQLPHPSAGARYRSGCKPPSCSEHIGLHGHRLAVREYRFAASVTAPGLSGNREPAFVLRKVTRAPRLSGKCEVKCYASAAVVGDPQTAAMRLNDRATDGQPHTSAVCPWS